MTPKSRHQKHGPPRAHANSFRANIQHLTGLTDATLIVTLRDAIAAAQTRPRLRAELRDILAGTLAEIRAEALSRTSLTPEQIAAAADIQTAPASGATIEPFCFGAELLGCDFAGEVPA